MQSRKQKQYKYLCISIIWVTDQHFFELGAVQTYSKKTALFWNTYNLSTALTNASTDNTLTYKESTISVCFAFKIQEYSYSRSTKEWNVSGICNEQYIPAESTGFFISNDPFFVVFLFVLFFLFQIQ